IPSERVFPSSKETCAGVLTSSPNILEVLHILKFSYKQDQLNYTSHQVPSCCRSRLYYFKASM
ncbi:hypothetical protein BDR07DRAFT_1309460, partial [Suillus spraguei]